MKNMNYTSDVEYEEKENKKFQITRGMVILVALILVAVIIIIVMILSSDKSPKEEYTIEDFNSLEQRMAFEASNYVMQKQILLTSTNIKIDLKNLLVENGGPIDPKKQKAAQVCDGYVLARKNQIDEYNAYIKCGDMFTTYGYESNKEQTKVTTTTQKHQNDTTPPDILLIGEKEIIINVGTKFNDPGATAVDNVDGDITSNIKVSGNVNSNASGDYNLVYSVIDNAGNKSEVIRMVRVIPKATTKTPTTSKKTTQKTTIKTTTRTTARPTSSPVITLHGKTVISLYEGETYYDPGYSAFDSLGTNITANVNVSGNVNTSVVGTYYVTYKVTDRYGNSNAATRTIYVRKKTISVNYITLTPNYKELKVGDSLKLGISIGPDNATDKSVSWLSSNPNVATVTNGIVYAKAKGRTTITVKTSNGKTDTATIVVESK